MKTHFKSPLLRKCAIICLVVTFTFGAARLFFSEGRQLFWSKKVAGADSDRHGAVEPSREKENPIQKRSSSSVERTKQMQERKDQLNAEVVQLDAMIEEEWARITMAHPECKRLREILANYDRWYSERRNVSSTSYNAAQTWFIQSNNVIPMREYYKVILTEAYQDLAQDPEWAAIINKSVERQLALSEAEKQSKEFSMLEQTRSKQIDAFSPSQVYFKRLPLDLLNMVKSGTIYKDGGGDLSKLIPEEVRSWMNDTTVAGLLWNSADVVLNDLESEKLKSLKARRQTAIYEAWNLHKELQTNNKNEP